MSLNDVTLKLPNYPMEELAKIRQRLLDQNKKVYDFGTGDPKIPTWDPIRQAAMSGIPPISQYPSTRGVPELIDSIWGYCHRHFGIKFGQGFDVMATNGSKEAIYGSCGNPAHRIPCCGGIPANAPRHNCIILNLNAKWRAERTVAQRRTTSVLEKHRHACRVVVSRLSGKRRCWNPDTLTISAEPIRELVSFLAELAAITHRFDSADHGIK
ncbi:MAG: hypothetical protein NTX25_18495, partial [Proteobacteria bacterium]|nr:hypothetical protein [Pseudomonadota bacterium]